MEKWRYKQLLGDINDICLDSNLSIEESEIIANKITKIVNRAINEEKIEIE